MLDVSNLIVQPTDQSGLFHLADTLEKRRYRDAELQNQKNARVASTSTFIKNAIDKKDYLNGSPADPIQGKLVDDALNQAYQLAGKGASAPEIMQAVAPLVNQASTYNINSKLVSKNINDEITRLKAGGYKGYNLDAIQQEAYKRAFYDVDPQSGQQTLKQDVSKIDPSISYVHKAIDESAPGTVTTGQGLAAYAKESPKSTRIENITTQDKRGNTSQHKMEVTAANWETPEVTSSGETLLVPKYNTATDNGAPLVHDFKTPDGKTVTAPVRLFDEQEFDKMMQADPSIADHIKSLVRQHIGEYKDDNGNPIHMGDPKAKFVAQALAYDYLKSQGTSKISSLESNKLSPQQINLNVYGNKYQQAYDARLGRNAADIVNGKPGLAGNAPETVAKIFMNDPDSIGGPKENINGRNVINVTGAFPKGGIKAGIGDKFKYKNIYYDPERRQLIVEKETGTPANKQLTTDNITEDKVPQFLNQISTSNNYGIDKIKTLLQRAGYKAGRFNNINDVNYLEQPEDPNQKKISEYMKDGGFSTLKGVKTPDGKIVEAGERSSLNPLKWVGDSHYIILKNKIGKEIKKTFPNKEALDQFLLGGVQKSNDNNAAPNPTTDLRKKYNY